MQSELGKLIEAIRIKKGIKIEQIAEYLGISVIQAKKMVDQNPEKTSFDVLAKIFDFLNFTAEEFSDFSIFSHLEFGVEEDNYDDVYIKEVVQYSVCKEDKRAEKAYGDKLQNFCFPSEKEYVHIGVFLGNVRKFLEQNYGKKYAKIAILEKLNTCSLKYISDFESGVIYPSVEVSAILMQVYQIPGDVMYNLYMAYKERILRKAFLLKKG